MSEKNHHHGSSINGFMIAMALGAGLVFLFGTKRGQDLVDEVTEKGSSLLDEIIDLLAEPEEDGLQEIAEPESAPLIAEPVMEQPTMLATTAGPIQLVQSAPIPQPEAEQMDDSPSPTPLYVSTLQKSVSRRMFHGIPKRK